MTQGSDIENKAKSSGGDGFGASVECEVKCESLRCEGKCEEDKKASSVKWSAKRPQTGLTSHFTLIGTGGPSVCWIDHKTTPFDNLYRGMEKESRKSHPKGREIVEQK